VGANTLVGDFNGDGAPDLAFVRENLNDVGLLLNNFPDTGSGLWMTPTTTAVGAGPVAVAAADFNEDGTLDLAMVSPSSNSVNIQLGNGNGTFGFQVTLPVAGSPDSVAVGDFNGDGLP